MSNSIPSFLKLHEAPHESAECVSTDQHELRELCGTFERVTGHSLICRDDWGRGGFPTVSDDDGGTGPRALRLVVEPRGTSAADLAESHSRADAQDHAAAINELVNDLQQTRHALWQREAELAAGVPVVQRGDDVIHLADRLEIVLRSGAEAVGCQAAALYMLNDDTSQLKLRAGWGLDRQQYLEPARPLRGAVADLEALIGHAVVLEDASLLPHWRVPLDYASAVCVPVATPSTILGTLWVFSDEPRDFDESQTNLIEIVAGRVAADLEREMLLSQTSETKALDRNIERASQWQQGRLPTVKPQTDHWQVAGWTSTNNLLTGTYFDWSVLANGQLSASIGQACGSHFEAALTSAALHSAVKAHAEYPHQAHEMLRRMNGTFWHSSTGGQFASLAYCLTDTERFDVDFAMAGDMGAILLRETSCEVLSSVSPWLGLNDSADFVAIRRRLEPQDALIVYTDTVRRAVARHEPARAGKLVGDRLSGEKSTVDRPIADELIAGELRDLHGESAENVVAHLKSFLDTPSGARASADWAILVLRRR